MTIADSNTTRSGIQKRRLGGRFACRPTGPPMASEADRTTGSVAEGSATPGRGDGLSGFSCGSMAVITGHHAA